jgi:hypothetical protein
LKCQGSFFTNVSKFSLSRINAIWSVSQSKLPKNIFIFTIRCINNTLPTRKNLSRWEISSSSDCLFCLHPESLLHVVAGCQHYVKMLNTFVKMLNDLGLQSWKKISTLIHKFSNFVPLPLIQCWFLGDMCCKSTLPEPTLFPRRGVMCFQIWVHFSKSLRYFFQDCLKKYNG